MSIFEIALFINLALLAIVIFFHLALISGAPWARYAVAEQEGSLNSHNSKIHVLISFAVYSGIFGHYLAQGGILPKLLGPELNLLSNWVVVGVLVLAFVRNMFTKNLQNRKIWGPISLSLLITSVLIALEQSL